MEHKFRQDEVWRSVNLPENEEKMRPNTYRPSYIFGTNNTMLFVVYKYLCLFHSVFFFLCVLFSKRNIVLFSHFLSEEVLIFSKK